MEYTTLINTLLSLRHGLQNWNSPAEELLTAPIWAKFPGLDFKYWSKKGLSKIGNLDGKSIMVDHNTEKRSDLNFARLLVEVEMNAQLPNVVLFRNERGKSIEQKVNYD